MTTTINAPPDSQSLILKADTRGRVRTPPDRREQLLDEFAQSGLSGAKFAALVGVKYPTFAAWVLRRKRGQGVAKSTAKSRTAPGPVSWLEAVVQEAQATTAGGRTTLVLHLPGGGWAEISDSRQGELAAALVRALEPKPC